MLKTAKNNIDYKTRYQNLLDSLNIGYALMDMDFGFLDVIFVLF